MHQETNGHYVTKNILKTKARFHPSTRSPA